MQVNVLQYTQIGQCRADLLHVVDDEGDSRWMVFFLTPQGPRVDTLSVVLRKAGGHFGNLNDRLGLVYPAQKDAFEAFSVLIDTVATEAGRAERLLN